MVHLLLFILSPIAALFVAIKNILRNNKFIYIIGAFCSLFAAYLPPTSDAYRYRLLYYNSINYEFTFHNLWKTEYDFLFPLLSSIFAPLGFSFEFFRFILIFSCYSLLCWVFLDIVSKNKHLKENKKWLSLAILALFLSVRFYTLAAGIRFGVASSFAIVSIYLITEKEYIKGISLFAFAAFMHVSILMFIPLLILAWGMLHLKLTAAGRLAIIILCLLLAQTAIGDLLEFFLSDSEMVMRKKGGYIDGNWGTEAMLESGSVGGLLFTFFRIFPIIPLTWFVLRHKNKTLLKEVCFLITILLCISISSLTILLRYSNIGIGLYLFAFLQCVGYIKHPLKKLQTIIVSLFLMFACYIYSQRAILTKPLLHYKVITSPLLLIETPSYSDEWVMMNIDFDGELKK